MAIIFIEPAYILIKCFQLSLNSAFSHFEGMPAGFIHTTVCPINDVPIVHGGTFQPYFFQISTILNLNSTIYALLFC